MTELRNILEAEAPFGCPGMRGICYRAWAAREHDMAESRFTKVFRCNDAHYVMGMGVKQDNGDYAIEGFAAGVELTIATQAAFCGRLALRGSLAHLSARACRSALSAQQGAPWARGHVIGNYLGSGVAAFCHRNKGGQKPLPIRERRALFALY